MLYYAIGDVHGCSEQLDELLDVIRTHASFFHGQRDYRLVLLGDYIDRGPDSKGVRDRVIALQAQGHIVLPGNHEKLLVDTFSGDEGSLKAADMWWKNGAQATLTSYGLSARSAFDLPDLVGEIPFAHRAFLGQLLTADAIYHRDDTDGLFFVHGGVRASWLLRDHTDEVLLWARPAGGVDDEPVWVEGLKVVHGHTPTDDVVANAARVGLDTGAAFGGALSAGVFVDGELTEVLRVPGWTGPE